MRAADDEVEADVGGWGSAEPEEQEMPPLGDADAAAATAAAAERAAAARSAARARASAASSSSSSAAAAAAAASADPSDPRRPIEARWLRAGAAWAPPKSEKELADEKEAGDVFLTIGSAVGGIGMWARVLPLCWLALLLALVSLGSRRADGSYKWTQFVSAFVFGLAGVATIIIGEFRPEASAAAAARPNPLFSLLRTIGVPVDAALAGVTNVARGLGLAK